MVVFAKYWKNLKNTVFWKFIKNYHLDCDKNHLKSNLWCLFPPPQKITAFRQAILEIIQIWTITLPTFQCQKTQVLQLFWTQNIALTGKKQPKYSFFTYQNPKKEMELSKFIIFNKMGVFSSISIQTTLIFSPKYLQINISKPSLCRNLILRQVFFINFSRVPGIQIS